MKALITGGAGFIGHHLAQRLLAEGHQVTIVDNLFRGMPIPLPGVTFIHGDIRSPRMIWFEGIDTMFNLAAISAVRKAESIPADTWNINATAVTPLMTVAHQAGVRCVLTTSSREVYGNPREMPVNEDHPLSALNVYGRSKLKAELLFAELEARYGLPVGILRLSNVHGPLDFIDGRLIPNWVSRARKGLKLEVIGGFHKSFDFVSVNLVVEALIRAASLPKPLTTKTPINIGSGQRIGLADVAHRVKSHFPDVHLEFIHSNSPEVSHFQADVRRMAQILDLTHEGDPLEGIEKYEFR